MREATDRTTTANLLFRGYKNADLWVDDVRFSDTGLTDPPVADTTAPSAPALAPRRRHACRPGLLDLLSWPAATDNVAVTGYKLYRGTAPGIYGAPTALGNTTSYTDATAVTGTRYYYAVSPSTPPATRALKSPEATAIAAGQPGTGGPAGLAAVGGTNQVVLTWNANTESDLSGYDVLRDGVKVNATRLTATTFTDTGLADGTTYAYRIVATDTHGNSSTGPAVSGDDTGFRSRCHAAGRTCHALSAIDRPADSGGAINLSWAAATDNVGVTGYRLYRGTAAGTYGAPTTLGNVTTYTDATADHRHPLLLRGHRRRRRRQRGRQVARGLRDRGRQHRHPARRLRRHLRERCRRCGSDRDWLDALGHPPARRVRHRPRQERHAVGLDPGPTTAAVAGVSTPAVMTSDGAEYRFWVYADTANENRYVSDTGSVFELRTRHHRPGRSSTPSAPPPATRPTPTPPSAPTRSGWAEYRVVLDFTGDTYTLFKRANADRRLDAAEVVHRADLRHPHA